MNLNSKNKVNPNFSMSSMTDLIFILLIFFLVTSSSMSVLILDKAKAVNSKEIENQEIIVTIKKDVLCETYQYILSNGYTCCGWEDAEIALIDFIQEINVDKEFSALILSAGKNIPHGECVNVYDFASKYDYNIGVDVEKIDKF